MISNSELFIQQRELELAEERAAEKKAAPVELEYLRGLVPDKTKENKPKKKTL
jgi:hypothetical protein